jgi:hypothetical protein
LFTIFEQSIEEDFLLSMGKPFLGSTRIIINFNLLAMPMAMLAAFAPSEGYKSVPFNVWEQRPE